MNPLEYFVCGGVGGICTVLTGHPLDTIKVRLQTMKSEPGKPPPYTGTLDCAKKIVSKEGVLGLYKGMGTPLAAVSPIFALCFLGYGIGRKMFDAENPSHQKLRVFASGTFAGFVTTIITAPGERVKCLLQIQGASTGPKKYDGPLDAFKKLYKEGGIASVYRGSLATALRDMPASGMYFLTYNTLTEYFSTPGKPPSFVYALLSGGLAGCANWAVGMPADTLKSRLQTAPEGTYPGGTKQVLSELLKKEGIFALYKGFIPVILRAFPANAACFGGFELTASAFRKFRGAS